MSSRKLYSFGFNAFQQTGDKEEENNVIIKVPQCHSNINKVLFTSWETTILLNGKKSPYLFIEQDVDNLKIDADMVVVWGFKPDWFDKMESLISEAKKVKSVFGDPNEVLGILDEEGSISYATSKETVKDKCKAVEQAVYCSSLKSIFTLLKNGRVQQINVETDSIIDVPLPPSIHVKKLCASNTHVLFLTNDKYTPIYALGSNRFSQLGIDYHGQQETIEPKAIDYFSGLGTVTDIACGLFHSAVIVEGDLYTFGLNRDGRLGWGQEQEDDVIACAVFLDSHDQPIEVDVVKVVCGSSHTLVLDSQGNLWSCGSNKYAQLGRKIQEEYDDYFCQCTTITKEEKIIDIYASRWNSFFIN